MQHSEFFNLKIKLSPKNVERYANIITCVMDQVYIYQRQQI